MSPWANGPGVELLDQGGPEAACAHKLPFFTAGLTMGTPKPRILSWLVSQLDGGHLEGVAWLNQSRTRFRIPWKHGLRQDAQQEDFSIFQVCGS